jgi:DNA-binding MarR family transcriptional regulator
VQSTLLHNKYWKMIRRQHRVLHRVLEKEDLYPGQPHILYSLDRKKGISQGELAEKIFVSPSTLAIMINRMEKKGLISRSVDSRDRRVKNVFLTEKGLKKRDAFSYSMNEMNGSYFKDFSKDEEDSFVCLIDKILNNMDAMEDMEKENKC